MMAEQGNSKLTAGGPLVASGEKSTMTKSPALKWGAGVLGAAAIGGAIWYLMQQENRGELLDKFSDVADDTREKAGNWARSARDKATPIMQTVADLVEKNAELVSAVVNVPADQVRKTGQEIRQLADTLERNLDAIAKM